MTPFRIVLALMALFAAVVGVVLIVQAARRNARVSALRRDGVATTGVIVDNQMHSRGGERGGVWFSPVVRFTDQSGRETTAIGDERSPSSWVGGQQVAVRYDPAVPERILVGDPGRAGIMGRYVVGVVFLAFAVAVWFGGNALLDNFFDDGPSSTVPGG